MMSWPCELRHLGLFFRYLAFGTSAHDAAYATSATLFCCCSKRTLLVNMGLASSV